jgi:hypothetical protein
VDREEEPLEEPLGEPCVVIDGRLLEDDPRVRREDDNKVLAERIVRKDVIEELPLAGRREDRAVPQIGEEIPPSRVVHRVVYEPVEGEDRDEILAGLLLAEEEELLEVPLRELDLRPDEPLEADYCEVDLAEG